jgi:hypothetical protein
MVSGNCRENGAKAGGPGKILEKPHWKRISTDHGLTTPRNAR